MLDEDKVFSILQKNLEANGSNVACVVLDDNEATIELIYIQSHIQRQCFESFRSLCNSDTICILIRHAHTKAM